MFFSSRMIGAFALGAFWFLMGNAWPVMLWFGLGYNILLVACCCAEWIMLGDCVSVGLRRETNDVFSIGASNVVRLIVRNGSDRSFVVQIKDEYPVEFAVDRRRFELRSQPGDTHALVYHVIPPSRGGYSFQKINARFQTFLCLLVRQRAYPATQAVRVVPDILQTREHALLARRNRLMQMGLRAYRLQGRGMEFERLRDYVPDDDLRRVDWKASARRTNLVTREYDIERSQNILLLLDCGRTMASRPDVREQGAGNWGLGSDGITGTQTAVTRPQTPGPSPLTKLDYAINACVMLAYVAIQTDDRVGLIAFADETHQYVPPGKGRSHLFRLTQTLATTEPVTKESNYRSAFHGIAQRMRKRSLVIVFTDLVDPDSSERLIANARSLLRKHLVLCVALSDYELPEIIDREPTAMGDLYMQAMAISILQDRRRAISAMQGQGVIVLDATPKDLTVAVVNKYLEIKREGRI